MKKLTKLLSIMLLTSITCGTALSDVQFGQRFTDVDDAKAAGFIRMSDYFNQLGLPYIANSVPAAVGHAAFLMQSSMPLSKVVAILTPDLSSYVIPGNFKTPAIHVLNINDYRILGSAYRGIPTTFARDNFYIHPTVTFPDIIKPFQS